MKSNSDPPRQLEAATVRAEPSWGVQKYSEALEAIATYAVELEAKLEVSITDAHTSTYFDATFDELKHRYQPYE